LFEQGKKNPNIQLELELERTVDDRPVEKFEREIDKELPPFNEAEIL
jgi:hypothetical protein